MGNVWEQLKGIKTKTSGFTLIQAIACAVEFDNQHCGIYAGDWDSYKDFAPVFDPIIQEYHGISSNSKHTSDMDAGKINGNIDSDVPVHSARIRVGRSIDGFSLSPGMAWMRRSDSSLLMTTSSSSLETETLLLLVWRETGLRAEASSTMMPRPSLSGSMRRISSELSPCRRVEMSRVSLRGLREVSRLLGTLSRRNQAETSAWMPSMVTSTLALPTWVLV